MRTLSNQQRLHLVNSEQLYENWLDASLRLVHYRYGMRWKKAGGYEYLFRVRDRQGNGRSMGRRSEETERILAEFSLGKGRAEERLKGIDSALAEQARMNKALRLGRVPETIARILRELALAGAAREFTVLGTQALYAYEVMGGVHFLAELLASGDVDLLDDRRRKLTLAARKMDGRGLLGLLKKADRSFEPVGKNAFRAANAGQFMVDLIVSPGDMRDSNAVRFAEDDLVASEVPGLEWLVNAPRQHVVAIAEDGWPVEMQVADPRAFAIHKLWLSDKADRSPLKRPRDAAQARILAQLIREHLPHLPLVRSDLRFLPKDLVERFLCLESGG